MKVKLERYAQFFNLVVLRLVSYSEPHHSLHLLHLLVTWSKCIECLRTSVLAPDLVIPHHLRKILWVPSVSSSTLMFGDSTLQ